MMCRVRVGAGRDRKSPVRYCIPCVLTAAARGLYHDVVVYRSTLISFDQ
jgi:hypothetical protein